MDFSPYDAVLLDLDGTVYFEDHALPGAIDLIHRLQASGRRFACLSNSTTSPARIVQRLKTMGVELATSSVYTAAAAAAAYVLKNFGSRPSVFNLATEGVQELLEGQVDWVQGEGEKCDAVVIGAPSNQYAIESRQRAALVLLRKGAAAIGICNDRVYPSPRGLEFGSGAFSAMLGFAAAVKPIFCGKPERIFFEELCRRLRVAPQRCILIGDNLESDVAGAKDLGMRTLLTLTGVAHREDLAKLPKELMPDGVVDDLTQL
jgi:HAD superfamily hydrolase (TIGR01450 family)